MAWSEIEKAPLKKSEKLGAPDGLWLKCNNCGSVIYRSDFEQNLNVCTKCQHHYPIDPMMRIESMLDKDSFEEMDRDLKSDDPLKFKDSKSYADRLKATQKRTGRSDAIITGKGKIQQREVYVGVMDFGFMGGSMGSVVGEKIARIILAGAENKIPVIVFSSSGGARMQEGILSLMQMGKTCAALTKCRDNGVPFISVLTHPTTGGVAASYAMLGDVNIAEPGALIGFAGPRVIRQTIGEELPVGFQRSEYLLEHGMVDMITPREAMRDTLHQILSMLCSELSKN